MLLERDAEVRQVDALAEAAARGEGAVLLVEGPAGIGKSSVLRAARDVADAHGLRRLRATGSQLDREFSFGVVHQLLDPVLAGADPTTRERLLAGAAHNALAVLEPSDAGVEPAPSHAVLHGLYWLCANLCDEQPLLILADDLHWSDAASLRLLEFLGRRLEGLPLLLVGAVRTGEPDVDEQLLALLAEGPATTIVRPRPLSAAATAQVVAAALEAEPAPAFVEAVTAACAGNPLLVQELTRDAAERGLRGTDEDAARVADLGSEGVETAVRRRLLPLGPDVAAVAQACVVLGGRVRVDDVCALTELPEPAVRTALERLVDVEILERDTPEFVHPLVRQAVDGAMPSERRTLLHARAAAQLRRRHARGEEVAVHLLATDPAGDPWVVATLRAVAATALGEGALDTAISMLRRALAEPPAPEDRADILLTLGELEGQAGDAGAPERFDEALAAGLDGDAAARARGGQARTLLLTDPLRADQALEAALADARDPALTLQLQDMRLVAASYTASLEERRRELMEAARAEPDPPPLVLAHLAFDGAYTGRPAAEVADYAERALRGGALLADVGPDSGTYNLCAMALRLAERSEETLAAIGAAAEHRRRTGSLLTAVYVEHAAAYAQCTFGSLTTAEAHARAGFAHAREAGLKAGQLSLAVILIEVLIERDALDEAAAVAEAITLTPELERILPAADLLSVRGKLRDLQGRRDDAEADLRQARRLLAERGWVSPLKTQASLRLTELLARRGATDEARELGREQEERARVVGTPGVLGCALRVRGHAEGDIALLEAAVEQLEASDLSLERGWGHHDLGAALRRAGRPKDAREPLRTALDAATQIGATRLAARAREELLAAGGRPRREVLSGPESLTPSERRVAELAASGLSNREIAETLWVARKTVEVHLGRVYSKLDIRSRAQLPAALGAG
ncbi:MAG: AAA family ATPase [Solirubrobacteraceae bacterium]|nr:AAA family ATPase [Solirubrobacteraceae bacterium]